VFSQIQRMNYSRELACSVLQSNGTFSVLQGSHREYEYGSAASRASISCLTCVDRIWSSDAMSSGKGSAGGEQGGRPSLLPKERYFRAGRLNRVPGASYGCPNGGIDLRQAQPPSRVRCPRDAFDLVIQHIDVLKSRGVFGPYTIETCRGLVWSHGARNGVSASAPGVESRRR
jgi:hypothetical protein